MLCLAQGPETVRRETVTATPRKTLPWTQSGFTTLFGAVDLVLGPVRLRVRCQIGGAAEPTRPHLCERFHWLAASFFAIVDELTAWSTVQRTSSMARREICPRHSGLRGTSASLFGQNGTGAGRHCRNHAFPGRTGWRPGNDRRTGV